MRLMHAAYDKMGKALKATGRPIVYSLCQYGWDSVWEWAPALGGNLWRTTGDIQANWNSMYTILSQQEGLESYAGPGHWNDPDMLEVGNGKLTLAENRTHFSMWAMLAAPLLAGNDLPNMKPEDQGHPHQQRRHRHRPGQAGQAGLAASTAKAKWTCGSATCQAGQRPIAVLNAGSDRYSTHPFHLDLAKLGLHGAQKRQGPVDRQGHGAHRQHADRDGKPRHSAGADRFAEVARQISGQNERRIAPRERKGSATIVSSRLYSARARHTANQPFSSVQVASG